jgi:hypothetical protein
VGAGAAPPPNPPPRPASGSHRLPNTLGQVGEKYGPSIAPFGRARCPFSPLLRPYSPGGAARGSHTGQFSCFGPRSWRRFIAFVLDIPNGFWPLDRAVERAYIRETVPSAGSAQQCLSAARGSWGASAQSGLRLLGPHRTQRAALLRALSSEGGGRRPRGLWYLVSVSVSVPGNLGALAITASTRANRLGPAPPRPGWGSLLGQAQSPAASKARKNTRNLRFFVFSPEKLGSCFFFSPTCGPAFGRSAHVRKPRAAHQPPRFRPAPLVRPPSPPPRRAASPPAHPGGPDRRFTGIDPGSSSKIHSFCGS